MRLAYSAYHSCSGAMIWQASTTLRSWTKGRTAIRASSDPSRLRRATTPPLSGDRASVRMWMLRPSSRCRRAPSFFGWSWFPAMTTAAMRSGRRRAKKS